MADYKYSGATPVDEPVAKSAKAAASKPAKAKDYKYPDATPVSEPVKKYAKGGGIESKGKTKGKIITMRGA